MTKKTYENFDLSLKRSGEGYCAEVLGSSAGEATDAYFSLPALEVDWGELQASPETEAIQSFGQNLFNTVFNGAVQDCFRTTLGMIKTKQVGLRIRLRLSEQASELASVPWEYLYDTTQDNFLALSEETPIVRYLNIPQTIQPLGITPPLHMLVMISNPYQYPPLDVEQEWTDLNKSLDGLMRRGRVVLERLEHASWESLQSQLRKNEYHVFHFIGHGSFDQETEEGTLLLEDETKSGAPTSGKILGTLLHGSPIRLVILNACEGARTSRSKLFAGVAQSLLKAGIPAVIAMQSNILDKAAVTFAKVFYESIVDGYPVDAALTQTRIAIYAKDNKKAEWGIPVLHMRSPDGCLFDIKPGREESDEVTPAKLREILTSYFSKSELQELCFDLRNILPGLDYENFSGEGKAVKVVELISYCERHGHFDDLVRVCKELRPKAPW